MGKITFMKRAENLKQSGGLDDSGGSDNLGGMEARVAKLEAYAESSDRRLSLIEQDLRNMSGKMDKHFVILLTALAAGFLVLAGTVWQGYTRLDDKIDTKVNALEARMNVRFDKADSRMDRMDAKLDAILERLPKK